MKTVTELAVVTFNTSVTISKCTGNNHSNCSLPYVVVFQNHNLLNAVFDLAATDIILSWVVTSVICIPL